MGDGTEGNALRQWNLERQLREIEALRSIYSGEGEFQMQPEEEAMLLSLMQEDEASLARFVAFSTMLSFAVHPADLKLGGYPVKVEFSLPVDYPASQAVHVSVDCGGSTNRQQHETINRVAREIAQNLVGEESILQILQGVQDKIESIEETRLEEASKFVDVDTIHGSCRRLLRRKLIWFHHIKSPAKRKCIIDWSKDLQLGGYCKPGFPGILICEGEGENVMTYVRQLQHLRWQALNVRGEEEEEAIDGKSVDTLRRFRIGIKELGENAMSELGALCREVGLESLFLAGLKISR